MHADQEELHPWLLPELEFIGSPDTVVEKLAAEQEKSGGYGNLLVYAYDFRSEPEAFRRHLELLGTEVAPALTERVGGRVSAG